MHQAKRNLINQTLQRHLVRLLQVITVEQLAATLFSPILQGYDYKHLIISSKINTKYTQAE